MVAGMPVETIRCRKLILGRDIGWMCGCATSTSDHNGAVATLTFKILPGLYLGNSTALGSNTCHID